MVGEGWDVGLDVAQGGGERHPVRNTEEVRMKVKISDLQVSINF